MEAALFPPLFLRSGGSQSGCLTGFWFLNVFYVSFRVEYRVSVGGSSSPELAGAILRSSSDQPRMPQKNRALGFPPREDGPFDPKTVTFSQIQRGMARQNGQYDLQHLFQKHRSFRPDGPGPSRLEKSRLFSTGEYANTISSYPAWLKSFS